MAQYASADTIKTQAIGNEASADSVWTLLADSVSRLFDLAANVTPDFFAGLGVISASEIEFRGNGTKYLDIAPYVADSLVQLADEDDSVIDADDYREKDGFVIFDYIIAEDEIIKATAKFGYEATPKDIEQACVEQALMMWRRKDLSFTEMSGVSTAAIAAPMSPTFEMVANKYRARFDSHFA